ncbi:hypothetical protein IJM86_05715 [bacterium]|nr:hypothetical protein [bacterium]
MAFDELKTILETKGDLQKFEKELEKSENQDKTIKITANNEKIDHDNDSATAEIFGSEVDFNVEPTNVEPTNVEPTNVEPTNVEPTNVEPTNVEPTNVEPTNVEPTNVEPTNVEPTNVEPTNVEPTNVEPTNVEPTNVEPTKPDIIIDDGSDNGHEVNENPTEMTFSAYIAQVL